jgi:hypothetical protein
LKENLSVSRRHRFIGQPQCSGCVGSQCGGGLIGGKFNLRTHGGNYITLEMILNQVYQQTPALWLKMEGIIPMMKCFQSPMFAKHKIVP